jgi:hypothetical protein
MQSIPVSSIFVRTVSNRRLISSRVNSISSPHPRTLRDIHSRGTNRL